MSNSKQFKRYFFVLLGAALLLIHSWFSYIAFHFPYLGVGVTASSTGEWVITDIYKDSTAAKVGLALNDTVVKVNKKPTAEHFTVVKFHDIEQAHTIEILRDGKASTFDIKNTANTFSSRYIIGLAGELVLFAISVFVYFKVAHSRSIYYLLAALIVMGVAFMCAEASSRSDGLAKLLVLSAMSFIPFLFAQFIYYFLKEKGYKLFSYRWLQVGITILSVLAILRISYLFTLPLHPYFVLDRFISLLCFALGCLLTVTMLIITYRRKRQEYSFSAAVIRFVFTTFMISFLPFLLLSVLPDLFGKPILKYSSSIWFITLFPAACVYYAVKHKWTSSGSKTFSLWRTQPRELDLFYRILAEIGQLKKLADSQQTLLPLLCEAMRLEAAAIRFHHQEQPQLVAHGAIDMDEIEKLIQQRSFMTAAYEIYPIHPGQDFSSHIVMRRMPASKAFNASQQRLINVFITQMSLVIENIYLSEKLSLKVSDLISEPAATVDKPADYYIWFRKSLYQMQEKERQRVASDLHDTIMQDLYFAKQRVTAIRNATLQPADLQNELKELIEYLDIINLNVRETGFQLYPHLLKEVGFAVTASNLIETERMNVPFQLHLRIEHKADWDALDSDTHHHLFRIMQELLSNAKKHSDASQVDFHLHKTKQAFVLEYRDDGVGFDVKENNTGIGWNGIHHRTNSLEGHMQYFTTRNAGLKLILTLPIERTELVEPRN